MANRVKLSELCSEISYGYTASADTEVVGPKFLRITDIQGGVVNWDEVPYCKIDEKNLAKNRLQKGDIVVARTGNSTGENYIFDADDDAVFASYLIKFRVNSKLANPYFVWLQMRTHAWWNFVSGAKGGSAQAGANAKVLGLFEVELPERDVQDKIVDIVFGYFNKIKLNRQTNQTLEQMAQALFKSWFVDFDPVIDNALAAGNDIPEALQHKAEQRAIYKEKAQQLPDFKPLPDNIRVLFPSEFEQTDDPSIGISGWIPKGWKKDNLKSFGKVVTGKTPPKKVENAFDSAGIPFITPTDVDSDVYALNVARRLTEDGVKVVKNNVIEKGSVCVTCIGSQMGKTVITPTKAVTNQQLNSIILSDQFSRNYIFMNLRTRREELFNLGSSGSTMPILNKSSFESLSVIRPSDDILKSFSKFTENQIEKILVNSKQNKQLENIRDSLLPKLISGEIKLPSKDVA